MNNHYSLKDKKISVWSFTPSKANGVNVKSYTCEYSKIWAYYRHGSTNSAKYANGSLKIYEENADALFIINKRVLNISWLIVYNHKIYEITRIDDYEGYADDVKVYCKMAEVQNFSAYKNLIDD